MSAIANELLRAAAFQQRGELAAAEPIYRSVLARDPGNFHASNFLGVLCHAPSRYAEAATLIGQAIEIEPRSADAHWCLGRVPCDMGRLCDAAECFQRAIGLRADFPVAANDLGIALCKLGRPADALAAFDHALALDPRHANAYANRSSALLESGRIDEVTAAARHAIELERRNAGYHLVLTESHRLTEQDPQFADMETLAQDVAALPRDGQIHLHFALGKAYRDQGRYEQSFNHFTAANTLKQQQVDYDEAATLRLLDGIRSAFTPEVMDRAHGLGDPSTLPIFIVGMPRSGTTLVEQILASHPKVHGAGELSAFEKVASLLAGPSRTPVSLGPIAASLTPEQLRAIGATYLDRLRAIAPAERITDKSLENVRFAGLIHLTLPNAHIIHVRRDPVATCLSCFAKLFAEGQCHTYDLGELGR